MWKVGGVTNPEQAAAPSDSNAAAPSGNNDDSAAWVRRCLGFEPDAKQARVLRSASKRGVLNCTRQWGKSTVTAVMVLRSAPTIPTRPRLGETKPMQSCGGSPGMVTCTRLAGPGFSPKRFVQTLNSPFGVFTGTSRTPPARTGSASAK